MDHANQRRLHYQKDREVTDRRRKPETVDRKIRHKKNEEGEEEGSIESYREANLPASRPVEDVVIPAYALYTSGTLNIGYLAYNHFSKEYNSELLRLSQLYKEKGVTDFILDLRYNDGGEMECVQLLADILVPADKLGSPFASLVYSQKRQYKTMS